MLYTKQIEVQKTYDLAVCGGGMTGFACAIAAARKGLKTVIIEKQGCLGGVATSAGVNHLLGGVKYDETQGKVFWNVRGIFKELSDTLITMKAAVDPDSVDRTNNPHGWMAGLADGVPFDTEIMKALLDKMCLEAGVEILYFTDIIDTLVEENKIKSVVVHNKSGLFAVGARYFADTTGDADLASLSGCKTVLGREEDHLMTPASLELHVENVDTGLLAQYIHTNGEPRFRKLIRMLRDRGEWTFPYEIFISVQLHRQDIYMINTIRQVGIDGTDGDSVTRGMVEGRAENLKLFELMKKYIPGFANARIRAIAPVIGIRETRRIVGDYVLTVEDLRAGTDFEDSIAVSSYGWDLPDPKKPSYQPMAENQVKMMKYTHIPYRCLLPSPVTNLIVAGRSVSVERDVLGPVRVMAPCMAMGQAAGTAAYFAAKDGAAFAGVDVPELQKQLHRDGCVYHIEDNIAYVKVNRAEEDPAEKGLCGC